jgi:UDP-2,3-diacylglucosamine hydrolase
MELLAPSRWRCVDFISDLHLHESDQLTLKVWSHYLQHTAADAVFILGDLFDVWVGDDSLSIENGCEQQCVNLLRAAGTRLNLYIMQGNRDFLMGSALMTACTATLLEDPSVLSFAGQRWLLTHGDALCLDDTDYMKFRAMVRSPQWQADFLNKPLRERMELARHMRAQSEARKGTDATYADVDTAAASNCLQAMNAGHMIHGHTHRPGKHALAGGRERLVLSDWDLKAAIPRAEILRLRCSTQATNPTLERIPPAMSPAAAKPVV